MINHSDEDKPPQRTSRIINLKMGLDQIDALSDCLIAIQASEYEVNENTITRLAFLIRERTRKLKNLLEEMSEGNRSDTHDNPLTGG